MRKNLNFIKTNFFLLWKNLIEYKANFYSSILSEFFYFCIMSSFLLIMYSNFADILLWKSYDFLFFVIVANFVTNCANIFSYKPKEIYEFITDGDFNNYLIRPINTFVFFVFYNMLSSALVMIFCNFIFLIGIVLFFDIEIYNLFLSLLIFVLIFFFALSIGYFIISLDFIKLRLSEVIGYPYRYISGGLEDYPAPFWKGYDFNFLFMFFHVFLVSFILIPVLRNYQVDYLFLKLLAIAIGICIFFTLTILIWRKGIKNYEAFG